MKGKPMSGQIALRLIALLTIITAIVAVLPISKPSENLTLGFQNPFKQEAALRFILK